MVGDCGGLEVSFQGELGGLFGVGRAGVGGVGVGVGVGGAGGGGEGAMADLEQRSDVDAAGGEW